MLQVQEQRMFYHHVKCVVTDVKVCRVCKKKIGNRFDSYLVYIHRNSVILNGNNNSDNGDS